MTPSRRDFPHVLIVSFDALRCDFVSVYGGEGVEPSVFDRAARSGIKFTNAIANANWTIPSHASLFTGLEPHQHRIFNWRQPLPAETPTIFSRLRSLGYRTAFLSSEGVRQIVFRSQNDFSIIGNTFDARRDHIPPDDDKPWCIFWHFLDTHAPYGVNAPRPANPSLIDFEVKDPTINYLRELVCTDRIEEIHKAVITNFARVSTLVNRLWDRLGENTITVLLSDHGEDWRPYHPFHCSFEIPVLKIPMVVSAPGLSARVDHRLISHSDVLSLIWRLVTRHDNEPEALLDKWQTNSDKLERVIVCGPDAFDNEEVFFAACNQERMVIVKPSTGHRQRFVISGRVRREVEAQRDQGSLEHLEKTLDSVLEDFFHFGAGPELTTKETDQLLDQLEKLGYI